MVCGYCKSVGMRNVKTFVLPARDLQGYAGYSPTLNGIVLSFRGSSNIQNWIINLTTNLVSYPKCSKCQVYNGFYAAYGMART